MISHQDLVEISLDLTRSHLILDGSGKISSDLARSRRVSLDFVKYRVHPKPMTSIRRLESTNPPLYWVGYGLKNSPPDLRRVGCGLGKNPTCSTCEQPHSQPTYKRVGFHGSIFRWMGISFKWSWKLMETIEKCWKVARFHPICPKSSLGFGGGFMGSIDFSAKLCYESPDLVCLCRIWLFWSPKSFKSS